MKIKCGDCGGHYGAKVWHSNDKYRRIVYTCTDDGQRYYTEDFPLAYLKYDRKKAEKADDGIKTSLPGSRFTLASDTSNVRLVLILIVSFGAAAVAVFNLCKKERSHE